MALQQDTVSIDLAQGVNNKVDDKIAGPEQTSVLIDARFDKDKRLSKRPGLTAQTMNFQGDPGFINSVSFMTGSLSSIVFSHGNQLCLENNGNLFSQYDAQDKWIFKGTYVPLGISASRLDANIQFTDTVTVNGITVASGGQDVYVSEEDTGTVISKTTLPGSERAIRLIGFQNSAYVLSASSGSALFARNVNLSNGIVGSQITVAVQYAGYNNPPNLSVTSSASAIGEAAFIAFTQVNTASSQAKVTPFLSVGSVSSLGQLTLGSSNATLFNILVDPQVNPNKFFISSQQPELAQAWTFGSTTYTNVWSTVYTANTTSAFVTQPHQSTMSLSPINNEDLFVYNDYYTNPSLDFPQQDDYSNDNYVTMVRFGSGGALISNTTYGFGYFITANPIKDVKRKSIYLPVLYVSPLQTTILLLDTLEGRSNFNYIVGKALYGMAASNINTKLGVTCTFPLSSTLPTSNGGDVYRITNNGYFVDLDLTPDNAPQAAYMAGVTHTTGGLLWAYDGDTLAEHNFLIAPEQTETWASRIAIVATLIVNGDGSNPETFSLSFGPAASISAGTPGSNYVQFDGVTSSSYLWFRIDGVGTDPAVTGRTGVPVDIVSTDLGYDVAYKVVTKINVSSTGYTASYPYPSGISPTTEDLVMQANSNGAVQDASVQGFSNTGGLSSGTYQFCTVWRWADKNGNIYRSAPSVPRSETVTGSSIIIMNVWAPPITNKDITDVICEFYGTTAGGTNFHLLSSTTHWSMSNPRRVLSSVLNDSSVSARALLYTTGGVLENYNIGACTAVSSFKERLQVTGLSDDPYAVYYSKTNVNGEPVNFAAETFYRVDADLNPVEAVKQMDDKSCVFKDNLIYVLSGDGANDLGEGSTFSPPMLVASDVGTLDPNSVVLYPNGLLFKSQKGIYELDRSLAVKYIGAPVEDWNSLKISGATLMKNQTEIRFTIKDTSTALIYNYFFGRWDYYSNYRSDYATTWNNKMILVRNSGKVMIENDLFYDIDSGSQSYSMVVETPWLKLKGIQDFQRIYSFMFLGEYLSPHTVTVNVAYDYDQDPDNSKNYEFDSDAIVGSPQTNFPGVTVYQFEVSLDTQKCQSIKVRLTEHPDTVASQSSLYLNNLSANVGLKKGLNKLPADKIV